MSITAVHVLHALKTPSSVYTQLPDAQPRSNVDDLVVIPEGHFEPLFVAGQEDKPEIRMQTHQVSTLLAEVGLLGADLSGGNAELYYRKVDDKGSRVADGTAEHYRFQAANAFMYLESLSAGHHRMATGTARLLLLHDGGVNPPLVPAGTATITDPSTGSENFVLGKCSITDDEAVPNTIVLDAADEFQLQLSPEVIELGDASATYQQFGAIGLIRPVITLSSTKMGIWESLHKKRISDITVNLIRKDPDGDNYGDLELQHTVITGTKGRCLVQDTAAQGSTPARTNLRVVLRAPDAATRSLAFALNSAVV